MGFEIEVELISIILLLELSVVYYMLARFYEKLKVNEQKLLDVMLLTVFRELLAFVSNQDIIEQGLIGSLINMKDEDLLEYLRSKIGDIKKDITAINDRISEFYNLEKILDRLRIHYFQIRWMFFIILVAIPVSLVLPKELSLVTLGIGFSLELVSLYYSLVSILLYVRLSKLYSGAAKSLDSL